MNLSQLGAKLPEQSITWNGFGNPVVINTNQLTGDTLTPESEVFEPIAKLVEGVFQLQKEVNASRATQNQTAIKFVSRAVDVSDKGNPMYVYTIKVEINTQAALNNLVSPIED